MLQSESRFGQLTAERLLPKKSVVLLAVVVVCCSGVLLAVCVCVCVCAGPVPEYSHIFAAKIHLEKTD